MGNICCETDIDESLLDKDAIKQEDYEVAVQPEHDEILQQWFKQNQLDEEQPNPPKLLKHKIAERYYYAHWKDGLPEGRGFFYEPTHLFYEGTFEKGLPNGRSTIRFLDEKWEFDGELKEGRAEGEGILDNLGKKFRFKGTWEHSKPKSGVLTFLSDPNISTVDFEDFSEGRGTILYKDNRKYEGLIDTVKIQPHGRGAVSFPLLSSKRLYEGEWRDGHMHGQGRLVWADGSAYEGQYVNGRKEGEGKFIFASKNYYEGFWLNGKQDGVGILYDKDGVELKRGFWSEGSFKQAIPEEAWGAEKVKCEKKYHMHRNEHDAAQSAAEGNPQAGQAGSHHHDSAQQKSLIKEIGEREDNVEDARQSRQKEKDSIMHSEIKEPEKEAAGSGIRAEYT